VVTDTDEPRELLRATDEASDRVEETAGDPVRRGSEQDLRPSG
jgi:hypothetical protein